MPRKAAPIPTLDGLKIGSKKLTDRQQRILAQLILKKRLLVQVQKIEEAIEAERDEDALIREQVEAVAKRSAPRRSTDGGRSCSGCELKGTRLTKAAKKALGEKHEKEDHKAWAAEHQTSSRALG